MPDLPPHLKTLWLALQPIRKSTVLRMRRQSQLPVARSVAWTRRRLEDRHLDQQRVPLAVEAASPQACFVPRRLVVQIRTQVPVQAPVQVPVQARQAFLAQVYLRWSAARVRRTVQLALPGRRAIQPTARMHRRQEAIPVPGPAGGRTGRSTPVAALMPVLKVGLLMAAQCFANWKSATVELTMMKVVLTAAMWTIVAAKSAPETVSVERWRQPVMRRRLAVTLKDPARWSRNLRSVQRSGLSAAEGPGFGIEPGSEAEAAMPYFEQRTKQMHCRVVPKMRLRRQMAAGFAASDWLSSAQVCQLRQKPRLSVRSAAFPQSAANVARQPDQAPRPISVPASVPSAVAPARSLEATERAERSGGPEKVETEPPAPEMSGEPELSGELEVSEKWGPRPCLPEQKAEQPDPGSIEFAAGQHHHSP